MCTFLHACFSAAAVIGQFSFILFDAAYLFSCDLLVFALRIIKVSSYVILEGCRA